MAIHMPRLPPFASMKVVLALVVPTVARSAERTSEHFGAGFAH
jgi:hypothetical protein